MTAHPMTEGEAEALFDKAVDALRAVYGAPMAASILEGRARLITKEVNDSLGWSPAVQKAMARFQDRSAVRGMRDALECIAAAYEDQDITHRAFRTIAGVAAVEALSLEGEDKQATRGDDAATAPTDLLQSKE